MRILCFYFLNEVFDLFAEEVLIFEDIVGNIDEILEKIELSVCKELEIFFIVSIDIFYFCFF